MVLVRWSTNVHLLIALNKVGEAINDLCVSLFPNIAITNLICQPLRHENVFINYWLLEIVI